VVDVKYVYGPHYDKLNIIRWGEHM